MRNPLDNPVERYIEILRGKMEFAIGDLKDYDKRAKFMYIISAAYIQFLDEHLKESMNLDEVNFKKYLQK